MRGLLWLVGAGLLLGSIDGGDTYEQLDAKTRDIVDQAIIKANEKYGQKTHIDFHSIICSDNSRLFHVLLKPTSCNVTKGAGVHQKECSQRKKAKPWVSCVACGENLTCNPFKNNKKKIEELKKKCGSVCDLPYLGGGHLMFAHGEGKEKEYGCLGCI